MARTKAAKKKQTENKNVSKHVEANQVKWAEAKNLMITSFRQELKDIQNCIKNISIKHESIIPINICSKTIGEWKSGDISSTSVINVTKSSVKDTTRKGLKKSMSFVEDDGYLTAESSSASSGRRKSRKKTTTVMQSTRVSRSLSRSKMQNTTRYKTPANKQPPTTYGTVTPKVKPNTPQVILRRPNQGEMALSLQGSPLFTGNFVSDTIANINIPLKDGRLFTLQPERGLRMSQVPDLAPDVKMQLQTLRDNLNKVVGLQ